MSRALSPLRLRGFPQLASAYTINELGNWVGEIALAVLVYDQTGSPLATTALFLGMLFVPSLIGQGVIARLEVTGTRSVLPALYVGEAVVFVALAATVDNFSLSPIAPVGFVAAVAMPRIELKLGTDTVFQVVKKFAPPGLADAALNLLKKTPFGSKIQQAVSDKLKTTGAAYAQVIITTSTIAAGAGSLIPCQKARLITTIQVGANATILGKDKGKVSKDIFHQEKTIVIPPTKSCDV